ncbi:Protein XRP2 [Halotydeus destructor]|nr:Protein XRP2 [Halotydeus destructor]
MGCLTSKPRVTEPELDEKNTYSWSNREKVDPKEYTIENENGSTVIRKPGSIKGQQFIVQNCSASSIWLFDHINTVTVDDCRDCVLFIGPTKGSIVLRNCINCRIMCASQQFRCRDCRCLSLFLLCSTKPTIESSHDLRFGCFSFYYRQLPEQFKEAGISIFNNFWYQVYDFNALDDDVNENHWTLLPPDIKACDYFSSAANFDGSEVSMDSMLSVVPQTKGIKQESQSPSLHVTDQICLVIFFSDGNREKRTKSFIREMDHQSCSLIRTREFTMDDAQGQQVFGTDSYSPVIRRGPTVALQYCGPNCIRCCQEVAKSIALETGSTGLVYVSNPNNTKRQVGLVFSESFG